MSGKNWRSSVDGLSGTFKNIEVSHRNHEPQQFEIPMQRRYVFRLVQIIMTIFIWGILANQESWVWDDNDMNAAKVGLWVVVVCSPLASIITLLIHIKNPFWKAIKDSRVKLVLEAVVDCLFFILFVVFFLVVANGKTIKPCPVGGYGGACDKYNAVAAFTFLGALAWAVSLIYVAKDYYNGVYESDRVDLGALRSEIRRSQSLR